jgi:beta-galactosidase
MATIAILCLLGSVAPLLADEPARHTFAIGMNDFLLDGRRLQIHCGEIHAARVPREYWRHRLQMARAMGLNTVCAYLFWNQIEPRPGEFDWSGQADVAEFCRIAQSEGLWVILRPGPYSCAEWEMGGLPWWLLKNDDIQLRTRDPRFLDAAKKYLKEVGRVLGPLQITHGGPILMVQVENEYGFQGNDTEYMGELRQALLDAGFNVPLFDCDPPYHLKDGYRSDLFPVVNFGSDPAGGFKALREILPQGPLMCGEFYPGWFDTWGAPHHLGNPPRYLADLEYMLTNGASFSIYMAHGGTTFGLWSGADRPLSHEGWTIAYVDSEERDQEDGTAENAIDGQTANYWHTEWSAAQPNHPHQLVLDLGKLQTISGFRYVPRQGTGGGRIKDCRIYVGDDLIRR